MQSGTPPPLMLNRSNANHMSSSKLKELNEQCASSNTPHTLPPEMPSRPHNDMVICTARVGIILL